ncbi:hypothetical protein Tco_0628396 [Tanacetum coccineum]|uniref:Uncharacterized protein n=1 Tax=Tanacetum coccineum TaxID=301880 RepID=A0ABQ4WQ79_9ASTR
MEGFRATFKPPIDYTPLNNPEIHIKASSSAFEQSSRIWERFLVFWVRYGGGNSSLVNPSSYAQVMAKMVKDLEACMVDSFALEMLPELVLDARFFVLVINFVFTSFLRLFLAFPALGYK